LVDVANVNFAWVGLSHEAKIVFWARLVRWASCHSPTYKRGES
jgi:hypothetical protein